MSSDAPNWRQSIITRIIDRNKRESSYHRELIQQNNRFYDTVVQLEAENLRINVENEKLRTAVATGGKDSGGSFAVLERLLAEQKHLTELHKRKGDNSQMIVDLSMKVEEQRKLLSEKEQICAEHMKINQILRAESAMLKSSLEELKKLDTTLRDEHTALQLAFSALEEKMRGIQDENRSLLERLMKYKSKDADKLNEENESFLKKRSDKLRRDLEDAVRETRNSNSPNDLPPEGASIYGGDQGGGDCLYDEMLMLADEVNLSPGTGPERFHSAEPELIMKFEAHETEASAVRWNPVEKMVATGGADRRVKLWDVNKHITGTTTEARAVLGGSSAGINSVEFDSTGSYILGTSNDFGARLWTVADHRLRMSNIGGYYKIVQTVNNGKSELSVVPSGWEKNGILFWPNKSAGVAAMLSIKDPNSLPGEKHWSTYKCIVKRPNVKWDFESAEKELKKMLSKIETSADSSSSSSSSECDINDKMPKIRVKRQYTSVVKSNEDVERNNLNDDVASEMTDQSQLKTSPVLLDESQILTTPQPSQSHQQDIDSTILVPKSIISTQSPSDVNPTDGVNLSHLMEILKTVSENVLSLNTKFDHMNKKVDHLMEIADNQPSKASATSIPLKTKMDPIATLDDLNKFEEKLKTNKEFSSNLIEKLKDVCGENSMRGENAAYTLVDVIFSRKLMTELSWAGGSKKGGAPKKAFKQFEHVLKLFYTLVKISDPTYTEVDAKDFFRKKVLPNSLRRSVAPLIRASQPKSRRRNVRETKKVDDTKQTQLSDSVKEEEEDTETDEEDEELIEEEFVKEWEELLVEEEYVQEVEEMLLPPLKRRKILTKKFNN